MEQRKKETISDLTSEQTEKKRQLENKAEAEKARKLYETLRLPVGENGYLDEVSMRKEDLSTIDWNQVLEKGLEKLKKMESIKKPDDLVFALMEIMLLSPIDMLTNVLEQTRKNLKENRKKETEHRRSFIENNLKANHVTMMSLAAKLSRQVQHWLLNDEMYETIPVHGPYTKYQKALIEKKNFALRLPKSADGNIDFSRMSFAQKRRFATYVTHYARSSGWRQYLNEMSGVRLRENERQDIQKNAIKMKMVRLPKEVLTHTR